MPLPLYGGPCAAIAIARQDEIASDDSFHMVGWVFQNPSVQPRNGLLHVSVTVQVSEQPLTVLVTISIQVVLPVPAV